MGLHGSVNVGAVFLCINAIRPISPGASTTHADDRRHSAISTLTTARRRHAGVCRRGFSSRALYSTCRPVVADHHIPGDLFCPRLDRITVIGARSLEREDHAVAALRLPAPTEISVLRLPY